MFVESFSVCANSRCKRELAVFIQSVRRHYTIPVFVGCDQETKKYIQQFDFGYVYFNPLLDRSRLLLSQPKVLLLDEPFAALDVLTIKMLQEIIVNLQSMERITVVVCDHQARDLLSCVDRAIVLSNGKIIASGSPNEIINDTNARSAYFGDEFKIN